MRAHLLVALVRPSITKEKKKCSALSLPRFRSVYIVSVCACYMYVCVPCVLWVCVHIYIYKLRFLVRFGELARPLPSRFRELRGWQVHPALLLRRKKKRKKKKPSPLSRFLCRVRLTGLGARELPCAFFRGPSHAQTTCLCPNLRAFCRKMQCLRK